MVTLINNSFKERRGKPAIWIEGYKLMPAFKPHERFNLIISEEKREVRFEKHIEGDKKVSVRSARGNSEVDLPLIEVRDDRLTDVFELGMKLRVVVTKGLVVFSVHGDDIAAVNRTRRFLNRIKEGKPLRIGSIFTGGGVLDKAIHEGLKLSGVDSYLSVCVESDERYVEALMRNQSELFRDDSIVINSQIEDVEFRKNFCLEVMVLGIPCTGSSQAGKSKLKIKGAEQHESAGACFFYALNMIKAAQPALIVLENVTNYKSEMSYFVIESVLKTWGYSVNQTVLNGNDYGCLEGRERLVVVAHSSELSAFSFDEMVVPLRKKENCVNDIMEPIPLDSDMWRSYDYLKDKEIRDKQAGKGFSRSLYDGSESSVTTIRRLYHKSGSCDQFVLHPNYHENGLTRKFTSTEHAKIKAIPPSIIDGVSETVAHEILGQSVTYWAFISVGYGVGLFSRLNAKIIRSFKFLQDSELNEEDVSSVCLTSKFDLGTFYQLKDHGLMAA